MAATRFCNLTLARGTTMELRSLGASGIHVSVLGLGTVKLGRDQEVKSPRGFKIPDDAAVRNLLALTRDLGINFIDTAPAYGNSEDRLGQLMDNPNDWVIMTKVGEIFENGQSSFDFSAEHTRMRLHSMLKDQFPNLTFSTLGRGLSSGTELEYSDTETLKYALASRIQQ